MNYFLTQDEQSLYYKDMGTGEPVILIHGWPLNSDMWEYQTLALLEQGYRVIAYDRRGFGRSSQPAGGYDYDTFATDLHDLITHLKLDEVSLVGFSMGGGEIARYLARFGDGKISRVALISSVVPYLLQTDDNPDGVPATALDEMVQGLRDDRPKFLSGFMKHFYGVGLITSPVSPETLDWTAFLAYQASPRATIDCVSAFGRTDFRKDVFAFDLPTLIVHGTADKTVPIAATAEAAARLIPHARFLKLDGAPHGLFVTHKEELNSALLEFLSEREAVRESA